MLREGRYFDLFNAYAELIVQGGKELAGLIGALVDSPDQATPAKAGSRCFESYGFPPGRE